MDIRKIRHVAVLAAEGNFGRAAEKLSLTQSALSQSIARLEDEIGLVLFDRNQGSVSLTTSGKEFVARSEELLIADGALKNELALMRENTISHVAFGFSPLPAATWLKPVLLEFARTCPTVRVRVELTGTGHLLDFLLQEEIEFFVAESSNIKPTRKLDIRHLTRIHVGFYVRKGHPLESRAQLTVADLRAYPVLAPKAAELSHAKIRYWMHLSAVDPMPWTMTCDDLATLTHLALNSDAVLLSPHTAVSAECAHGQLSELQLTGLRHQGFAGLCQVSLAKRTLSPAAKMVAACVETHLAEHELKLA